MGPIRRLVTNETVIYVLIPAFDEADRLQMLLPAIPDRYRGHEVGVVVICDGSTDGTCRVAREHGAELIAVRPNQGKGHALQEGSNWLTGRDFEAVAVMDGDGQHDPSDLPFLFEPILTGRSDVSIGSRYFDDSGRGPAPLNRYLVRTAFTKYLRRRLRQPVSDPFSGFRCMSADAFRAIGLHGERYEGELEVRFEAEIHGFELVEVPVRKIYSGHQSKMAAGTSPLRGRARVVRSYVSTVRRKSKELGAARTGRSVVSPR